MDKDTETALNIIGVALSNLGLAVTTHLDDRGSSAATQNRMLEFALTVDQLNKHMREVEKSHDSR